MPKVSTEKIKIDDDAPQGKSIYSYDIYVDKEGLFSTTLPKDLVTLLKEANVSLRSNRMRNEGYLTSSTFDGLVKEVKNIVAEYKSREIVSEKIVIKYCIQTQCSYAKSDTGEICPNPKAEWTNMSYQDNPNNKWHEGTKTIDACHKTAFGFQIYAEPFVKRDYKYKSGKIKIEYEWLYKSQFGNEALEKGYNLKWLSDVPCIDPVDGCKIEELDYTENVAMFFVNMIKSICVLNEKIKDFIHPDKIKEIAELGQKLLG